MIFTQITGYHAYKKIFSNNNTQRKLNGDYNRYLVEFKTGEERKEAADGTLEAYKSAQVSE